MNTDYYKSWTVTMPQNDIYFDIEQLSIDLADVTSSDNMRRHYRLAVDMTNANDARVVRRLCEHRLSRIRQQISRFIAPTTTSGTVVGSGSSSSSTPSGSSAVSTGAFTISLKVPTEAEENTLPSLASAMHQYIVAGALADYYEHLGHAANRESLNKTADEAMATIRELIYYRPMP